MKLIFQINDMLVALYNSKRPNMQRVGYFNYYKGDIWAVCVYRHYGYDKYEEYEQISFKELV